MSDRYLHQTLHHLSQVVPVVYRRLFDGAGLYHQGALFALVVDNRLYFRVDEHSVHPYTERRMPALRPSPALSPGCHFYQLPDEVLQHPPELLFWMRAAVEASQAGGALVTDSEATGARSSLAMPQPRTIAG